jgi:hydrogenase nickel incorporation protein HypA/HybF
MHELPATEGILAAALEAAHAAGAERVLGIDLVVGELTSIVDDSVQFYFDILGQGTAAAGAVLRFRRVGAACSCSDCGHAFAVSPPLPRSCPACGSPALAVTGGQEFHVESIEVADEGAGGNADPQGERCRGAPEP